MMNMSNLSRAWSVAARGVALVAGAWAVSTLGGVAHARDNVYWSIGVDSPGVSVGVSNAPPVRYYHPAPVVVAPPPVVYAPPPPVVVYPPSRSVRAYPPVVYYAPPPVVYGPPPGHWHKPRHWKGPDRWQRDDRHWRDDDDRRGGRHHRR